jgi:hypothetical protein
MSQDIKPFLQMQIFKSVFNLLISIFLFSSFIPPHEVTNKFYSGPGFAVVELFTSEGCSSCPPADEAVGRLEGWEKNVFVLSFHVDYWNNLGWKDIFSNPAYSSRQKEYGTFFHLSNIYTPQIVINGKVEFVGSEESRLRKTIQESILETPSTEIHIKVLKETNRKIPVTVASDGNKDFRLNLALVQNYASDFVQRGENKGKTLSHFFIVREFKILSNPKGSDTFFLNMPTELRASNCTVIAFLQDSNNGHIIAATGSSIP